MECRRYFGYLLLFCAFWGAVCGDSSRVSVLPLRSFRHRVGMFLSARVDAYQEVIYRVTNTSGDVTNCLAPPLPFWLCSF